jgi:hypothetical protein
VTDLWHPQLERTISVSEKMARRYRRSGWVDVNDATVTFEASPEPDGPLEADLEQGD